MLSVDWGALSSPIAGVPTLEGPSDSSSITKAFSNSEGSGPRAVDPSLSFGRARLGLDAGDSVLELDRLAVEADLATEGAAFARACSSAIRESIAPLSRYEEVRFWLSTAVRVLGKAYLEHVSSTVLNADLWKGSKGQINKSIA